MYVVAVNRKAVIGYKRVNGRVEKILPGRRCIGLFGRKDTGKSALISLGESRYTGAVGDDAEEGGEIDLFVFPDQRIYTSLPEGDVCDVDEGTVPEGRFLVKDSKGARKAFLGKYGFMLAKILGGAVIGAVLGFGVIPAAGVAFFLAIAFQSVWAAIANGSVLRLYKTDTRKLTFSGRKTI